MIITFVTNNYCCSSYTEGI